MAAQCIWFVDPIYAYSATTSHYVRVAIASVGLPFLFLFLSTMQRFHCYSIAKFGTNGHAVSRQHNAMAGFFLCHLTYAFYSRMYVSGMAGAAQVVGLSLSKRTNFIATVILFNFVQVVGRFTTLAKLLEHQHLPLPSYRPSCRTE